MDKLKQFELMEKIVRQLEDLNNSQQAVLEKIGHIEVENMEVDDQNLGEILPEIHQRTADNLHLMEQLMEDFEQKTSRFGEQHQVDRLRELEAGANK